MQIKKIILASASPRRKELLMRMGVEFDIMPCDVDEKVDSSLTPIEVVEYLANLKASSVKDMVPGHIVIGADTIVVINDKILCKPIDKLEAYDMIKLLSNSWHEVVTGICMYCDDICIIEAEITRVHFVQMSDDEIHSYVNTSEPYDKAGGYGVQGLAGMYIDNIQGDYYNIMGFPMAKVKRMLDRIMQR